MRMNMKMGQRERARERELFPLIHDKIKRERERVVPLNT